MRDVASKKWHTMQYKLRANVKIEVEFFSSALPTRQFTVCLVIAPCTGIADRLCRHDP